LKSLFQHSPADSKNELESNPKIYFRQAGQTKPAFLRRIFRPQQNLRIVSIEKMPDHKIQKTK
ncbi:hypothetical protein, partial [Duncaniella muris]|uniref:hypothetical protein n=1 Tax=Duncaniella muris TaxID=2094150 RepID=UPI0025B720AB